MTEKSWKEQQEEAMERWEERKEHLEEAQTY